MFCALALNLPFFKERLNLFVAIAPAVKIDSTTAALIKNKTINDSIEGFHKKHKLFEM